MTGVQTCALPIYPSFIPHIISNKEALKGWSILVEPQAQDFSKIVIDTTSYYEGNGSVRIDASEHDIMLLSDPFKIRKNGGYYCRVMTKTNSTDKPQLTLRMICFKENGKITNRFHKKGIPSGNWTKLSLSAGFLKSGVNFGRVAILIPPFKEGSIWIDDAGCWDVYTLK